MTSRLELSPKHFQVRLYPDDSDRYSACLQLHVEGDKGFIHSLVGKDFYRLFALHAREMFEQAGIKSIQAYVQIDHADKMRDLTKEVLKMEFLGLGDHSGKKMEWVRLTLKEKE